MKRVSFQHETLGKALSGQLAPSDMQHLIGALETELNGLLPTVNREFANVATEAFDLSQRWAQVSVEQALRELAQAEQALNDLIHWNDAPVALAPLYGYDDLPSPEMLFSSPDAVPLTIDWQTREQRPMTNDIDLDLGQRSISTASDLYGNTLGVNNSYDA